MVRSFRTAWSSLLAVGCLVAAACTDEADRILGLPEAEVQRAKVPDGSLDAQLQEHLRAHGFTGGMQAALEERLGRPVNGALADVGRLLFFDPLTGLNGDNSCSGCHGPQASFGDSESIAIGVENNGIVGPDREGPRNQRRSPSIINSAFYPRLMWNGRFHALSEDPFDNTGGFAFPAPEGTSLAHMSHLLGAQAHIPFAERVEMTGFDFVGDNDDIRAEVLRRVNSVAGYRRRFARIFPEVGAGGPITFEHVGASVAEFTFSVTAADAPIDRFARGRTEGALTTAQKRGAVLFFGRAGCVECHAVSGSSNEMFSDFENHVIAVPQIVPSVGNVAFDGPGENEDFGAAQITGNVTDRYAFRTSPLRNVGLQKTFMHNGAFVHLEDAIRHHLDVRESVRTYSTDLLDADLRGALGPMDPVLSLLDWRVAQPIVLSDLEFADLVDFVRNGLTDDSARPERLHHLVPGALPSGLAPHVFQF